MQHLIQKHIVEQENIVNLYGKNLQNVSELRTGICILYLMGFSGFF
jgi:hypothetical protein